MAVTTHTISGNVGDLVGEDFSGAARVTVLTNLPQHAALVAGTKVYLGPKTITVSSDGTFEQPGFVASDSADTNIDPEHPLQYQVQIRYVPSAHGPQSEPREWTSDWFELTADTNVATAQARVYLTASFVSEAMADVSALVADAETARRGAETARSEATQIALGDADATLAAAVDDSETLTGAALFATYGRTLPVWDDFTQRPDGKPTTTLSGHPYTYSESPNAGADLRVDDGELTHAPASWTNSAGYATVDCNGDVAILRATFKFNENDETRTQSGQVAIISWETDKVNGGGIPNAGCHFTILPDQAVYGLWDNAAGGLVTNLPGGTHSFFTPLARGVEHTVTIHIDKNTSSATVLLPNGATMFVSDPRIAAYAGSFACIELYEYIVDLQVPATFLAWGAASERADLGARSVAPTFTEVAQAAAATPGTGAVIANGSGSSDANVAITDTPGTIHIVAFTVPPAARWVWVDVSLFCTVLTGGTLVFYVSRADLPLPGQLMIENSAINRAETFTWGREVDLDGLNPGDVVQIVFYVSGANATYKNFAAELRKAPIRVTPVSGVVPGGA